MLSFYPSADHTHYSSARPLYSDDIIHLHPSISEYSYRPRTANPESRYRRALAEYLVAEQELIRSRNEATLRARAEALRRQEEERLLQARITRAREVRQARQLEEILVRQLEAALAAKTTIPEAYPSLPHTAPGACSASGRRGTPIPDFSSQGPQKHVSFTDGSPSMPKDQPEHRTAPPVVPENGTSATLESLLQARLRKVACDDEDEEMQDLARATLSHLVQHTPALSSEPTKLDSATPAPWDTDLSRSDALQGNAAEAAKASFKAHRATVAEQAASPVSKTAASPLEAIQDIRAALSKLSADFSIPPSLDFSDDEADGLAYTPTNAPIRVYELALERLLSQLDAVDSDGDDEVRDARRAVVKEVEMALEGVEKKVKRAREVTEDNIEPVLAEATELPFDFVEEEDTHTRAGSVADAKIEQEDSSLILSHTATTLAPVSVPDADVASSAADEPLDVVPDITAIEDESPASDAEESIEVDYALTSSTRPATVQDEVAHVYTGDVPESAYSATGEQPIPTHEPTTSDTHEEAVSLSPEGFVLTSTPVSPAFSSPALPEDISSAFALPIPEREVAEPDDADNEEEWSEVEA